jgi:arylsulfatase
MAHDTMVSTMLLRALLPLLCSSAASAADERPNVLIILVDDMGFSDIGCFGGEIETPHLDALAREGARFTQAYDTSKCFPSRACLLTGAYAQQVGMHSAPGEIVGGVTFGEVLRAAGYRTYWSGKHHGAENPVTRGFDRYYGLRDGACNHFNPGARRTGEPVPAQKRANRAWCIDAETLTPYTPPAGFYSTDAFTDAALGFLDDARDDERPFLLYLAYTAPHDPLMAWPADIEAQRGRYDAGWAELRARRFARQKELGLFASEVELPPAEFGDWAALSEAARAEEVRRMEVYAAMVACVDRNVGRVLARLAALGELEDTLVIFASDNGGSAEEVELGAGELGSATRWASVGGRWANVSNTPFRRFKNWSLEGGICTPLIVRWPGHVRVPGGFVRAPVHFVDVMPTLVEACGATYPAERAGAPVVPLPGESLVPLLAGVERPRAAPLYFHWGRGRALRDGRWKLVRHADAWELYDLEVDRTELCDLAGEKPERLRSMIAQWEAWSAAVTRR